MFLPVLFFGSVVPTFVLIFPFVVNVFYSLFFFKKKKKEDIFFYGIIGQDVELDMLSGEELALLIFWKWK